MLKENRGLLSSSELIFPGDVSGSVKVPGQSGMEGDYSACLSVVSIVPLQRGSADSFTHFHYPEVAFGLVVVEGDVFSGEKGHDFFAF